VAAIVTLFLQISAFSVLASAGDPLGHRTRYHPIMHRTPAPLALLLSFSAFAPSTSAQSVSTLWEQNCQTCHGERGQGGGAGARTLLTDELRDFRLDRRFFDSIKNGLPEKAMPGFAETLSEKQIWALVVHTREIQAREHRKEVGSPKPDSTGVYTTTYNRFKIETVVPGGVDVPWSVDFLPEVDGVRKMLITGRSGDLRVHSTGRPNGKLSKPIAGTPAVRDQGQGGLMDVAVHPDYATNGWVYLAFSDELKKDKKSLGITEVVRGKLKPSGDTFEWTQQETIFKAKPEHYYDGEIHFGCRIVFTDRQPDGRRYVYFGIGERGRGEMAQDLTRPNGKVHRLWDDGKAPDDNPFVSNKDAYPSIWSFGHRNPQGLAFDLTGQLWDTEHGPRGGDELNLIQRGRNFGWPLVSFGINYNDSAFVTPWRPANDPNNIAMPAFNWTPSIGACGLDVARGPMFERWKGDLLAGGLSGANVDRLRVKDGQFVEREEIIHGMGRVRDVVCAPDGSVYVVLNDPDKVIRLVEVK
jgi:glucose/arabinose dehydrogenase